MRVCAMLARQRGATTVELALVLPLLLLVVDGVMEFSMVMYDKVVITNAARSAARAGIVLRTPKLDNAAIAALASTYCASYLLSFDANAVPVVRVIQATPVGVQTPLQVTVSYTYTSMLLGSLFSAIGQPLTLSSTAVAHHE